MKKKILALLLCLSLVFSSGVAMAATQTTTVKEDKTAKIFVDGVALKNTNVLILNNGTPMLSTELFKAIGVSEKNQVWDKSKTKLTLTKGKTKVIMQINSANVTLNGKKVSVSIKPFSYKNKAYFPVDFIAECFDKQFCVDTETNTYFLKNKTDFANNKKLLDNIVKSMNSISKLKISENCTLDLNGTYVKLKLIQPVTTSMDRKSKIYISNMNHKMTTNGETEENDYYAVSANDKGYIQIDGGEWQEVELTPDEFSEQFDFKSFFNSDDVICSALNTVNGVKKDEVILKGNTIIGDSITTLLEDEGFTDQNLSSKSIEITLNKTTNIVNKIVLKVSGTTIIDKLKYNLSVDYLINFSDINGSFKVVVPDELK